MLRLVPKDNIFTINYEDLVKEPMKEMNKIQKFLKKQKINIIKILHYQNLLIEIIFRSNLII